MRSFSHILHSHIILMFQKTILTVPWAWTALCETMWGNCILEKDILIYNSMSIYVLLLGLWLSSWWVAEVVTAVYKLKLNIAKHSWMKMVDYMMTLKLSMLFVVYQILQAGCCHQGKLLALWSLFSSSSLLLLVSSLFWSYSFAGRRNKVSGMHCSRYYSMHLTPFLCPTGKIPIAE